MRASVQPIPGGFGFISLVNLWHVLTRLPQMTNQQIPEVTPESLGESHSAASTASIINVVA